MTNRYYALYTSVVLLASAHKNKCAIGLCTQE